jgi:hypothetical protein
VDGGKSETSVSDSTERSDGDRGDADMGEVYVRTKLVVVLVSDSGQGSLDAYIYLCRYVDAEPASDPSHMTALLSDSDMSNPSNA